MRGDVADILRSPDEPRARAALPLWTQQSAPAEKVQPRPLMPSRPDEEDTPDEAARAAQGGWTEPAVLSPLAGDRDRRFLRGTLLHRLLQRLPDMPVADRLTFAATWLAREAADLDSEIRTRWAEEAVATLG